MTLPLFRLALLLTLCGASMFAQETAAPQQNRIADHANLRATTRLEGHVPTWAMAANDAGSVSDSLPLRLTFVLARSPESQTAFTQLLEDQQDPSSDRYHHWLTPQQVGNLYGPTQHDLDAFTGWLTAQGLAITEIAPSRVFITVDAPAAVVGNALGTSFRYFSLRGEARLSAASAPAIPSAFAAMVGSITGLVDLHTEPMHHAESLPMAATSAKTASLQPQYTSSSTGNHYVTPGDFATIFDLKPVYNNGLTGTGQKVAIIGRSRVVASDVTQYESITGLSTNLPNTIIPTNGVDPGVSTGGDQGEALLDVDRLIGTAPGVQADLVVSASTGGYDGIYVAAQYEVQTLLDPVMNISFGSCEPFAGPAGVSLWDTLFAQAASEGISVFVSSADSGAATCSAQFSVPGTYQFRAINYICASSYATCVGGTEFADTANPSLYWSSANDTGLASATGYIPEGAWNEPMVTSSTTGITSYVAASGGGGASIYVPKPAWQTGAGVPADSARDVPDVSFPGAAHDGYFACYASVGGDCGNNRFVSFSGTSAAAPSMAGVAALLNQKSGGRYGNLNPLLYRTATATPLAFHDATAASSGVANCNIAIPSMCNNSTPSPTGLTGGIAGYALTAGYDQATGLGSLDVANFLASAVPATPLAPTKLVVTESVASVAIGQTATFTATLTATTAGTPTGTVQFYSDGTALGAPVGLAAGKAVSPATPFTAAGSYLISATYTGDAAFAAATAPGVALTVAGAVSFTSVTASTTAVPAGTSATFRVSVAAASGTPVPTGIVRLYLTTPTSSGYINTLPLSGGALSLQSLAFTSPGSYSLSAFYLGDTIYSPSHSTVTFTVQKLASATQLSLAAPSIGKGGSDVFTVTLSTASNSPTAATPTGTVQLYSNGAPLGSSFALTSLNIVGAQAVSPAIAFLNPGTYSITAVYSGDASWLPSTSAAVTQTVTATPAAYQLSASLATVSLAAGGSSGGELLTITPSNGFAGPVTLTCAVAYNGTVAASSPPSCMPVVPIVTVGVGSVAPSTFLTITTTASHSLSRSASAAVRIGGSVLAALLLCMIPLRRRLPVSLLGLVLLVALVPLAGCGSGSIPVTTSQTVAGTTPGSYTVTVTATTTVAGIAAPAPVTIALTVQ